MNRATLNVTSIGPVGCRMLGILSGAIKVAVDLQFSSGFQFLEV
jgi:hypothetical protein